MLANASLPDSVRGRLEAMGYTLRLRAKTSGPINGILFDREHGTMWGASSNYEEDYGIPW
jgi:gamma-glutamyltranspeptidase/glutathione hydrolase